MGRQGRGIVRVKKSCCHGLAAENMEPHSYDRVFEAVLGSRAVVYAGVGELEGADE